MCDKDYIAFIVEGEAREPQIIDNMKNIFFTGKNIKTITLPAEENIYMLWKSLKEDDFETDLMYPSHYLEDSGLAPVEACAKGRT